MASENPTWGYTRIRGALWNLGDDLGRNTIRRILVDAGLEPAPEREKQTSWSTFLKAHWGAIAATDFFTVEVVTNLGLVRYFYLVHDRDPVFTARFAQILLATGVSVLKLHQGLGNQLIEPPSSGRHAVGAIKCRERLGGTLRYYHREAA